LKVGVLYGCRRRHGTCREHILLTIENKKKQERRSARRHPQKARAETDYERNKQLGRNSLFLPPHPQILSLSYIPPTAPKLTRWALARITPNANASASTSYALKRVLNAFRSVACRSAVNVCGLALRGPSDRSAVSVCGLALSDPSRTSGPAAGNRHRLPLPLPPLVPIRPRHVLALGGDAGETAVEERAQSGRKSGSKSGQTYAQCRQ
jgi:hypothetical protein